MVPSGLPTQQCLGSCPRGGDTARSLQDCYNASMRRGGFADAVMCALHTAGSSFMWASHW